ncbi:hypothetical protein ACET3Z_005842 [Daucus carota]
MVTLVLDGQYKYGTLVELRNTSSTGEKDKLWSTNSAAVQHPRSNYKLCELGYLSCGGFCSNDGTKWYDYL